MNTQRRRHKTWRKISDRHRVTKLSFSQSVRKETAEQNTSTKRTLALRGNDLVVNIHTHTITSH